MSEGASANLPRFDVPGEVPRLSALRARHFDLPDAPPIPTSDGPETSAKPDEWITAGEANQPEPVVENGAELAAIETTLTALSETLDRIERESREQVVTAVQSIAAKLFPELSRLFMAEEINHHLPQLIPISAATVIIHTPPSLMDHLRQVIDRSSTLSPRCTLVSAESSVEGRVEITWQTGGLTFDFKGLLDACLAQLSSTQTNYGSAE